MIVEIKIVPKLIRKIRTKFSHVCGLTTIVDNDNAVIEIAKDRNKDLAEFSITLLHEFLHVWLSILKANGVQLNSKKEHKFIYEVEAQIANLAKMLKR